MGGGFGVYFYRNFFLLFNVIKNKSCGLYIFPGQFEILELSYVLFRNYISNFLDLHTITYQKQKFKKSRRKGDCLC